MDDAMWSLMQECWEPRPSARFSADAVCRSLSIIVDAPTKTLSDGELRMDAIHRAVTAKIAKGKPVSGDHDIIPFIHPNDILCVSG